MRKLLALFVCVVALPTGAIADDAASIKKTIESNHDKAMAQFGKGDLKPMMALCADDYEAIGGNGTKMNKGQMELQMRLYMTTTKKLHKTSYKISNLKVKGAKASGKVTFSIDADVDGMMFGSPGKIHRMGMVDVQNASWVKRGGKWLVQKEKAVSSKMTLDGKPFDPSAPPAPK